MDERDESVDAGQGAGPEGFLGRSLDFLGLERNVLVMIFAASIQMLGAGLWMGYVVKVLDSLGAAGWMIGFYAATGSMMSAVAPYPAGLLSDRLGRGRVLIVASSVALAGFLIYLVAPTWWLFIPGAILVRFAGSFRFMGSLALTGDRLREKRRAISIGVQNIFQRLPRVISPFLGGALIALCIAAFHKKYAGLWTEEVVEAAGLLRGFRIAMAITMVLTVVAIVAQRRLYRLPSPKRDDGPLHPLRVFRSMSAEMRRLLLADSLIRIGTRMYMTFVQLYVLNVLGRGYIEWGSLQSLQALTSVVVYLPVAKLSDRAGRKGRRPFVGATFFFFALFPIALVTVPSASWLIPVFMVAGLREFGEPARKALIMDLASRESLGRQMGVYYMVRGISMSLAPLVGGVLWSWRYSSPFVIGGVITAAGLLWFVVESIVFGRREGHGGRP
ncbi:MAG: MFS transporter [Planctomycetota bacterium]